MSSTLLGVGVLVEPWLCVEGMLTWEMFRLNHAFGLGKPCLKFTGKNEAEFTMWCLRS